MVLQDQEVPKDSKAFKDYLVHRDPLVSPVQWAPQGQLVTPGSWKE